MIYLISFFSTIVHEFVHALGAFHVHSRSDRDKYVKVDFSNIKKGKEHNFKKHANCPTYGTPYDPMSLMHYEHYAFAIDRKKSTIYSKVSIRMSSEALPFEVLIVITHAFFLMTDV